MKKAILYGILFCLVTLNLPKAFFHAHDHQEHHTEKAGDFSFNADESDCFVCDIDLTNFSFTTLYSIQFDPKAPVDDKELVYFREKSTHFDLHQLRGPPTII